MDFVVPESLRREHRELHGALDRATAAGGETGMRAKEVVRVLHPHFLKEEEFALPPLGLLVPLAKGQAAPAMRAVLAMTDRLKAELPQMEKEHREIMVSLRKLAEAARREGKADQERLVGQIEAHAIGEEEVTYPAVVLVGEYLKLVFPG